MQAHIQESVEALSGFAAIAKRLGVKKNTITAIQKILDACRKENSVLLR
ncbi:hypothetical protein [Thiopseudomonas acetoxidans]|uniref:Uncharacterized protein n=1 Tax=Thiopseudomonas acetoxidans TaxID=3041622 RepID=A0ABT7SSM0_9GAMM|nr:hypothetical protein [Thiopseudomonas sp. CY1220]MDM7858979.1 hypothetical protein [Thiopseudomonas sp. CY1220]